MKTLPDFDTFSRSVNRRAFLTQSAYGLGGLALASLMGQKGHRVAVVERWPELYGLPRLTHVFGHGRL